MDKNEEKRIPLNFTNVANEVGFSRATDTVFNKFNQFFDDIYEQGITSTKAKELLENPRHNYKQIVDLSINMMKYEEYRNVIVYMTSMPTLNYVIIPKNGIKTSDKDIVLTSYKKWENYLKNFRVQDSLYDVLTTMAIEDVYYGYERRGKEGVVLQKFEHHNCMLIGKTDGLYRYAYNMESIMHRSLLNSKDSLEKLEKRLKNYPVEFVELYQQYYNTGEKWQVVSASKGVCFKWRTDLEYPHPPFISSAPKILTNEEDEELSKFKDRLDLFKLLVQKIPFRKDARSEDDLLIDLESVVMFHNNIKSILPKGIEIATTPMEINDISFPSTNKDDKTSVDRSEDVYSGMGKPGVILSGIYNQNSVAIIKAIEKDSSEIFRLLRQFETFFFYRANHILGKHDFFSVQMPNLTVYNIEDRREEFTQKANFGIGKSLLFASYGYSLSDIDNMVTLENDIFNIDEKIKPLVSPYNQSLKDLDDKGGREEKSSNKLSDKGSETRANASNLTRDITS